jgi:hypothetical protein
MTDQISRAQRRRTTRSTAITTANNATTQTSTQIHSGMSATPSQRLCCRAGWCHSGQVVVAGAERPPRCAAVRGPLPPPAAPHGPAVCLLDGLPPRRLHGQGSLRAHECSLRLRRPLDRSGVDAARRHRSPGAGEEQRPTSRQHEEAAMPVFEQDWLELGSRVARSLHYQHPRNLRLVKAAQAEGRR